MIRVPALPRPPFGPALHAFGGSLAARARRIDAPAVAGLLLALLVASLVGAAIPIFAPLLVFLLPVIGMVVAGFVVPRLAMPKSPLWWQAIAFVAFGNLVLNHGFANIAFDVGAARLTLSESVLLLALLASVLLHLQALLRWEVALLAGFSLVPLAIHLPGGLERAGLVAARDALPAVDALFLLVGLAVVSAGRQAGQWERWKLRFVAILTVAWALYAIGVPFAREILSSSPAFFGMQQYVPLFGYYKTSTVGPLAALLALVLLPEAFRREPASQPARRATGGWLLRAAMAVPLGMALILTQNRSTYVAAAICVAVLALCGYWRIVRRVAVFGLVILAALLVVDEVGLEVEGRVAKVGFSTVVEQLDSIDGEGGHAGQAGGTAQRLRWWAYSLALWSESPFTVMFGIGYGEPLTDHVVGGTSGQVITVREPHSSFVSTLTRTGLLGLLTWAALLAIVFARLIRHAAGPHAGVDRRFSLWALLFLGSILVVGTVEPTIENPYFAIPFYLVVGMVLGDLRRPEVRAFDSGSRCPPTPLSARSRPGG